MTGGVRRAGIIGEFRGFCRMAETVSGTGHIVRPYGGLFPDPVFAGTGVSGGEAEREWVSRSFPRLFDCAVCRNRGNGKNQGIFSHSVPLFPFFPFGNRIREYRLNPTGEKHKHEAEMSGWR